MDGAVSLMLTPSDVTLWLPKSWIKTDDVIEEDATIEFEPYVPIEKSPTPETDPYSYAKGEIQ
jgi:hypothetical protein